MIGESGGYFSPPDNLLNRNSLEYTLAKIEGPVFQLGKFGLVACIVLLLISQGRSMIAIGVGAHLVIIASIVPTARPTL